MNSYNQTIEYIDFNLMDSWKYISINKNLDNINLNLHCMSSLNIEGSNSIIIFGGIRDEEIFFDSFLTFDSDNNLISKITIKNKQNYACIFTKNSNFIKIDNNNLLIDDNNNIHVIDNNLHFSMFKCKI